MPDLTFTGPQALIVHDVGEWNPGESKTVEADLAERLLKRADFTKTPKPVPARAPRKPADAAAEAKSTPRSV